MTTNYQAPAGSPASDCSAFSVGDRVTTVKSDSLPESMEGIPCIVTAVDMATDEEYFRYEVAFRMDHKTPIRMGEDVIATELLDRSNLRLGWQNVQGDSAPKALDVHRLVRLWGWITPERVLLGMFLCGVVWMLVALWSL